MATFPSSKVGARALSSANWAEVPCGKSLASMGSQHLRLLYTQLFFFTFMTKLLPSVYQTSSGLVRGSFHNPSWGFVQQSKVSRQE